MVWSFRYAKVDVVKWLAVTKARRGGADDDEGRRHPYLNSIPPCHLHIEIRG